MFMANGNHDVWEFENLSGAAAAADDEDDGLCMDIDTFWDILGESPDYSQNGMDDTLLNLGLQGEPGLRESEAKPSFTPDLPVSFAVSPSYHSEVSDSRTVVSDGSLESAGNSVMVGCAKLEPLQQIGSPMHSSSGSLTDWVMPHPDYDTFYVKRDGRDFSTYNQRDVNGAQFDMANINSKCEFENATFSFADGGLNHQMMENSRITPGSNCNSNENSLNISGVNDMEETSFMDLNEIPEIFSETSNQYHMQNFMDANEQFYFNPLNQNPYGNIGLQSLNNDEPLFNIKAETEEFPMQNASLNSGITFEGQVGRSGGVSSEAFVNGNSDVGALYVNAIGSNPCLRSSGCFSDKPSAEAKTFEASRSMSNMSSKKQVVHVKDEKTDVSAPLHDIASQPFELLDDVGNRKFCGLTERLYAVKGSSQLQSVNLISLPNTDRVVVKDEKKDILLLAQKASNPTSFGNAPGLDVHVLKQPFMQPDTLVKRQRQRQLISMKEERENKLVPSKITCSPLSKNSHQAVEKNASSFRSYLDDPEICILEEISEPARKSQLPLDGKALVTAQRCSLSASTNSIGLGGVRLKTDEEKFLYRAALQDLSQPKSEASPPDGLLAVPLLKHQRIALSWMVQKETNSANCCGGILADDQGLGKTISTIALILKERPVSSSLCNIQVKPEMETLNLDDDDDDVTVLDGPEQIAESCQTSPNGNSSDLRNTSAPAKGRPAAGTLVVCPTSVLRQWSDELRNKVSKNAGISVLVYHGGNRTKDTLELAKYDVVLTTYSIVSVEVPKQPLVDEDEDEDETKKSSPYTPVGLSSSKKRKYPPSSIKKCLKGKKAINNELFESLSRPLARVAWFRIVLDEAQSIKNHRTQVARACWGLRAKRRWCLSGTPIQNAIDDLYSYFRFLRCEPFSAYKSFCSQVKVPIQKNPSTGYRKLQAILKTIMLRRTKGSLLDGEPIINLPPKTIELKKVDFTCEERDFYCRLEADSRAQFEEYAAAGTVKQNYVNILLMLLRLRQACDHPLLVQGVGSNNEWRSSLEMVKKLPRERQIRLLNCLEASLAICGLCSDPPEDAVVTSCEHVFCNQCILEHLSGDDNQCPFANCKTRCSASSVFSRATLRSAFCDQPSQEDTAESSGSISALEPCSLDGASDSIKITGADAKDESEPCSSDDSFDSSKIKAALEVLQSLSKPQDAMSTTVSLSFNDGSTSSPKIPLDDQSGDFPRDINGSGNPSAGEKAIVFSQWTRMLDLLEGRLKTSSINYRRLDGTMSVHARDKAVKDFNSLPEVSVMIMSLKAASLGLNMVAACHVLLLDLWWNPTTEDQAIDRAHRIGQTRPVTVLRLTVKDTVEDRILALQQKKREMVASAFGEDEMGGMSTRLTVDDLKYLFMA